MVPFFYPYRAHGTLMVLLWYPHSTLMVPFWYPYGTLTLWYPHGTLRVRLEHPYGTLLVPCLLRRLSAGLLGLCCHAKGLLGLVSYG